MRPGSVLLFALLLICGCTTPAARQKVEVARWMGHPENELLQIMGAPDRSYDGEGLKVLTYQAKRTDVIPGAPVYAGPGPLWWGAQGGIPPQVLTLVCDTNFTIAGGVIAAVTFRGNGCD